MNRLRGQPLRTCLFAALKFLVFAFAVLGFVSTAEAQPQSFTFLQAGFTQNIVGVDPPFMGGVAFAPNGDPYVDFCSFSGSPLRRFDLSTTIVVNGTNISPQTPGSPFPSGAGCGLTNHPDGTLYSNTSAGVVNLDANTGAVLRPPFGPAGNALGIAVDPQTNNIVYVAADCRFTGTCTIISINPVTTVANNFAALSGADVGLADGIFFDPTGNFLFIANRSSVFRMTVLNRAGAIVQHVPTGANEPDGIAFHSLDPQFVVTNNTNGTMTRFDFPGNDFTQPPVQSVFASGGFRGDLAQVGPDGCLYITQAGTRFNNGVVSGANSLVRICPGFAPPPGVQRGKFVYTNNNPLGRNTVSAFSVADDGTVTEVTGSPFPTGGNGSGDGFFASNRMVALVGNFLYASNDGSNTIAGFSINPSNGVLTPVPGSPFPTGGMAGGGISMAATPNRRFLYAGSAGSRDIRIFRIGLNGALSPAGLPPVSTGAAGPDGMKVSGDGKWLAAALPLAAPANSGAVAVYSINSATGAITPVPGSPFPASPTVNGGAAGVDINCASDTLFLAEATGVNQIVDVFNIDATTGVLTRIPGSPFNPGVGRNSNVPLLCVQDTVLFVSNQFSNTVSSYTVAADGSLTLVAPPFPAGPGAIAPAGMAIDEAGVMLFVANFNGVVSAFTSDSLGVLTPMTGSPFPTNQPRGLESLAVFPPRTCPAQ